MPFGIVVVGLALILLAIVFRSIAVPIKATLGYLLSIAAALGAVTATCIWGWLAGPLLHLLHRAGGQLLADHPHGRAVRAGDGLRGVPRVRRCARTTSTTGDARHAIRTGFICSARVVTAAAIIMISVFAAFIPDGSSTIKPIALGLAVGVFVDAFLVRMTLVPAVSALLGRARLVDPAALDRALPSIDVEGQSLVKHVEQAEWEEGNRAVAVRGRELLLESARARSRPTCGSRTGARVDRRARRPAAGARPWPGPSPAGASPTAVELGVLGRVLPEESGAVRKKVRVVPASSRDEDELTVRQYLRSVLVAQSSSPWRPGDAVEQALDQSEAWLDPLTETDSRTQTRLEDRRLGALSAIERQLVALSAAATQAPELIVVQDADAGLGTVEMSWFSGVCHEIVGASDATVLLWGRSARSDRRRRRDGGSEPAERRTGREPVAWDAMRPRAGLDP